MSRVKPGIYQHYKGRQYEVVGIARHSETLEEMVVYRALYESEEFGRNALWARPLKMFNEKVNIKGVLTSRFRFISDKE